LGFHQAERRLTTFPVLRYCSGQKKEVVQIFHTTTPAGAAGKVFDFTFARKVADSLC
jgi:hypothetical protein